jgi:hypothetical protein
MYVYMYVKTHFSLHRVPGCHVQMQMSTFSFHTLIHHLCVCVCVYMRMCICVYMSMCMYMCVCVYEKTTRTHIRTHNRMLCSARLACTFLFTHTHTHIFIHTHTYIYICTQSHTYTHTYTNIHTHTTLHTPDESSCDMTGMPSAPLACFMLFVDGAGVSRAERLRCICVCVCEREREEEKERE